MIQGLEQFCFWGVMTPLLQVFFGICGGKVLLLAENQHSHRQQAERLFYWLKKKKVLLNQPGVRPFLSLTPSL